MLANSLSQKCHKKRPRKRPNLCWISYFVQLWISDFGQRLSLYSSFHSVWYKMFHSYYVAVGCACEPASWAFLSMLKSQHVVACFAVGRYLLMLSAFAWCGACLELLCELYAAGGYSQLDSSGVGEAVSGYILYICLGSELLVEAIYG